jgi:tRNA(Ile)-lysidine synthase
MIVDVSRTGVAVSGGADSVYLLHEMVAAGRECVVLHVNHLLRGDESDADEAFVRGLAASLGVECLVLRERPGNGNLEQAARLVRYRWFRELIAAGTVERVALGHTLSDQAETVLFRFLRGAGTAGLAGIRPATREVFRPLLGMTREAVRESLLARGVAWREDSSNASASFARNRIRAELLPQLEREWNPGLTGALGQVAEWALAEEKYWAGRMKRLGAKYFSHDGAALVARWPMRMAVAVERRLVRHAIETVLGHLRQIEYGHVEAVRAMRSGKLSLPGLTVEKSFEWLRFAAAGAIDRDVLDGVGLELLAASSVYNRDEHQLDWGSLSGPLRLRSWHPGDRYRRVGRPTEERLKLLFQKARIPVWERRSWPVLLCEDKIVWARKFGAAEGARRTDSTQTVLLVRDLSGFPNLKP